MCTVTEGPSSKARQIRVLGPDEVHFFAPRPGHLGLRIGENEAYGDVLVLRCFPMTAPEQWVSVRDRQDPDQTEIGLIRDIQRLPEEEREHVERALRMRYFVPKIERVLNIKREYGAYYWDVETDKGERSFIVKSLTMSVFEISPGRFLVTDVNDCRYEIPDVNKLDSKSLQLLRQQIYI